MSQPMPLTRGRGWRRIGIVLSVVWFVGFGFYVWTSDVSHISDYYAFQLRMCNATDDLALEHTKKEECKAHASTFQEFQLQNLRSSVWLLLLMDLGTIAIGWLIGWLVGSVGRWIYRGFVSA